MHQRSRFDAGRIESLDSHSSNVTTAGETNVPPISCCTSPTYAQAKRPRRYVKSVRLCACSKRIASCFLRTEQCLGKIRIGSPGVPSSCCGYLAYELLDGHSSTE